jgi:phosphoglycolate phosphatase-like HAD superfamily hydrolase
MVGDSIWDCEAAQRAGLDTIGVLTGGFARSELEEKGAAAVFESVEELRNNLEDTPLR